jgi:hypothetical protein
MNLTMLGTSCLDGRLSASQGGGFHELFRGLFNDAVSTLYTVETWINDELEEIWKESILV